IGQVAAQAGCGTAIPAPSGGTPSQVCGLLDTVQSTAATIQQTAQTQSGQQLPVDLSATIGQVAAQAGCGTASPAAGGSGTTTSTTSPATGNGSAGSPATGGGSVSAGAGSTGASASGTASGSATAGNGGAGVNANVLGETAVR